MVAVLKIMLKFYILPTFTVYIQSYFILNKRVTVQCPDSQYRHLCAT